MIVVQQVTWIAVMREWLPLIIAFAAVIVGPFVQRNIANHDRKARHDELVAQLAEQRALTEKQIFASVRSSNRQAWIDALRGDVANYLNLSQRMALLRAERTSSEPGSVLFNMMVEAGHAFSLIQLRLNPDEEMHQELLYRLAELNSVSQNSPELFEKMRENVIKQAQKIFKFEWNRVKRGE